MNHPVVTVFGSAQIPEGDPRYQRAELAGRLLAEAGFAVCSGGYQGLMAAVSRGCQAAGGPTIGVTLKTFDPRPCNPWIDQEIKAPSYLARMERMISLGQGYLVLDGGIGTLTELGMAWSLLQIGEIPRRPCVLLGEAWSQFLTFSRSHLVVREADYALLACAADAAEAVRRLAEAVRLLAEAAR